MMEFAPGLLSMTTGWPQVSCILAPTMRAMMSLPPPGGKPTTMRIGLAGWVCVQAPVTAQNRTSAGIVARAFLMVAPAKQFDTVASPARIFLHTVHRFDFELQ